jgi:hypothetical protein
MCISGIINKKNEEFYRLQYIMPAWSRQWGNSAYCLLYAGFLLGLLFSPDDEATCSSEMLVDSCWTLHNHSCENLKSYIVIKLCLALMACFLKTAPAAWLNLDRWMYKTLNFISSAMNMEMHLWYAKQSLNPFGSWNIFLDNACMRSRFLPKWNKTN